MREIKAVFTGLAGSLFVVLAAFLLLGAFAVPAVLLVVGLPVLAVAWFVVAFVVELVRGPRR